MAPLSFTVYLSRPANGRANLGGMGSWCVPNGDSLALNVSDQWTIGFIGSQICMASTPVPLNQVCLPSYLNFANFRDLTMSLASLGLSTALIHYIFPQIGNSFTASPTTINSRTPIATYSFPPFSPQSVFTISTSSYHFFLLFASRQFI